MAPLLTRIQDCGWTSADVPEIKDKNASVTLRDSVDLSLSYSLEKILSAFISEYQSCLGLQPSIITLLNASWLVTVRCFCPVQDIHLGRHSPDIYFTRFAQGPGRHVAIELNCEVPVKDLVRNVSLLESEATSHMSLGDHPSDEASEKFLTTTICYAGGLSAMAEGSSNRNLNTGHINSKLFLDISQANGELQAKLTFSVSEISRELALSMLHTFNKAIRAVVSSPLQSLGKLDLCSKHDRQLLQKYTESVSESYEVLLHDLALQHAQLTPDAPAVHSWDGDLTYAQLDDATSRLGQFLASMGVGPGTFVISCFEKSTWAIVARLAILKAGAAYISVDATDPPIYLENVIRRVNAKIILTSEAYQSRYTRFVPSVIAVTPEMVRALPVSTGIICPWVKPSDVCLILFTSGSTGEPKGIIQEHRAYATAVRDYNRLLGIGRHSRVLQFDDYAFDISNNDYLTTLTAGGCCCVHTPTKSVSTLVENINILQVNMTFLTPTIAAQISPQDVPTLELVCLGGEPMPNELLIRWSPHVRLVNQYGMGESATFCAYNDQLQPGQNAIVGRSGSGAIWITSPESPELLMPVGAVGEILIEGPHLARGYLDGVCQKPGVGFLPNAPTWLKDLHPSRAGTSRFYRSGDLGRYTHARTVEHLGRKDTLLKINGYRVEATEVEYILRRSLTPADAVIVDLLGEIGGPREPFLVAFLWLTNSEDHFRPAASDNSVEFLPVTSHHSAHRLMQRMRAEVMATLPVHKIPEYFILVSQIPRTRSNKTDRRKLHHLAQMSYLSGVLSKVCNK
ncbi:putative NRPS-like enzyme [Aspergillus fischeri NRRL 181]|uniref:NRPS-like enzyme, putative n=1 Tax=Neosartorya fischeri (strain ATCC 1020 / DSM 3700 / CBS 544.65 / FGSC A1164 / JCM 1740 / NRRL 181 / WB 181) TaxID=331117 RepID=A1CVQ8_NEOFI|nr:NRPS-like enzyme, putative [Aspergillus fischeri NRRL 181]EAW24710.1 NRPS-like enzyme, putative [Aspergillus fischeri NRRL 181]